MRFKQSVFEKQLIFCLSLQMALRLTESTRLGHKMDYSWDDSKNAVNLEKHGLSFEDAHVVFAGRCVTFEDDRYDYGEPRFITLGTLIGRVVVIVHTPRNQETRIISMRKANEREQKIYQKRLGSA